MERRGVSFGDRVAVLMGNRPEFMETVLAANLLGAIAVPVNFRLSGPEIAYVLDNCGARVLVVDDTAEEGGARPPWSRHPHRVLGRGGGIAAETASSRRTTSCSPRGGSRPSFPTYPRTPRR